MGINFLLFHICISYVKGQHIDVEFVPDVSVLRFTECSSYASTPAQTRGQVLIISGTWIHLAISHRRDAASCHTKVGILKIVSVGPNKHRYISL